MRLKREVYFVYFLPIPVFFGLSRMERDSFTAHIRSPKLHSSRYARLTCQSVVFLLDFLFQDLDILKSREEFEPEVVPESL